ncbi:hypothetical protein L1049_024816 [Liquidambar formosana]|uniref:Uncharacterized protein n=1 Tax=Liquidambar formosana TaxID=63359 RepID=A0AAP0S2L2_LIQFO
MTVTFKFSNPPNPPISYPLYSIQNSFHTTQMGCCTSTDKPPKQNPHHENHYHRRHHDQLPESDTFHLARAPPPVEEETVKEVLSETPLPKPSVTHHSSNVEEESRIEPTPMMIDTPIEASEVSEVSEMYSMSESVVSTTTVTEKRDDEAMSVYSGEAKRRVERSPAKVPRKRPYSGEVAGGKERKVIRSPAKRAEPSMEKRSHIPSRGQVTAKRRNVGSAGIRRDSGEISGRRSRSPVARAEGGATRGVKGGSSSLKVTGRVGGQTPAVAEEKSCEVEKRDDGGSTAATESLENPLVSLECFIFL